MSQNHQALPGERASFQRRNSCSTIPRLRYFHDDGVNGCVKRIRLQIHHPDGRISDAARDGSSRASNWRRRM